LNYEEIIHTLFLSAAEPRCIRIGISIWFLFDELNWIRRLPSQRSKKITNEKASVSEGLFLFHKNNCLALLTTALDLFSSFANITASPKFQDMIKTVLVVLFLSFGPHVLITNNNGNLETRQRHVVLIKQGFLKIDYQQSYGIFPRSVNWLAVNQQEKKEAPIFAGATNFVDSDIDVNREQRQKKKLTGLVVWRTATMLIV
jgi:hypothetical protein